MRIAFLVQLPENVSPGQRFRIEQYKPHLDAAGYKYKSFPFFGEGTYKVLYKKGYVFQKAWGVFLGFLNRLMFLFKAGSYDYIFLQREAAPLGPPVFEWLLARVFKKKLILDFDDAIWIPDSKNTWLNWFRCYWKVKWICKWSYKVVGGNEYLCSFARNYNNNVILIPTCVDTENRHNKLKHHQERPLTIGWTGSHSTLKYLTPLVPLVKSLAEAFHIKVLIICNREPDFTFQGLEFIKWDESTEIEDLLKIHIGIMPLVKDPWSEGKCGFKLIQYLSLGIPCAASPVGVNKEIIENGKTGFLCNSDHEWREALTTLLNEESLRVRMGLEGREKIKSSYSISVYGRDFLNLFH